MTDNKRIIYIFIVICALFLSLITYLLYFNMFRAREVSVNAYNRRQWDDERKVLRGTIYDSKGIILAQTKVTSGDKKVREYTNGSLYSHIIGYSSEDYGKSQLEMRYNTLLLGKEGINMSLGDLRRGYDLTLTIDNEIQKTASNQLNGRQGAVVALEPKTGRVIAMVSNPDFDPSAEALKKNWKNIVEREDSPLLPRATQGLYAPGSTYKIVTAAAAYEQGMKDKTFDDTGSFQFGSNSVSNYNGKAYGSIDLAKGFAVSSNFVFCSLGYDMGEKPLRDISSRFGIDKGLDFDLPVNRSVLQYKSMTRGDSALVAIGQGKLLTTPLEVALIASAAANGGTIMKPYLVEKVTNEYGNIISQTRPSVYSNAISADTAAYVKDLMIKCVNEGTGTAAKISGVTGAGKTGTAENEQTATKKDKNHAWFVGFAPADDPKILVAVLLEYSGGTGGEIAAPIARNVISKYLNK